MSGSRDTETSLRSRSTLEVSPWDEKRRTSKFSHTYFDVVTFEKFRRSQRQGRTQFEISVLDNRLRVVCFIVTAMLLIMYIAIIVDLIWAVIVHTNPQLKFVPNLPHRKPLVSLLGSCFAFVYCCVWLYGCIKLRIDLMWQYLIIHVIQLFDCALAMLDGIIECWQGNELISSVLMKSIVLLFGSFIMHFIYTYYTYHAYPYGVA